MHLMLDLETDNQFQCVKHFDALSSSGRVVRMILSHKVRHYKGHLFEGLWKRGEYVHHIIHPLVVKRGNEKSRINGENNRTKWEVFHSQV